MRNLLVPSVALIALSFSAVVAAGDVESNVESGLKVGQPAGPFNVIDSTGPAAGKTLCYR